MLNMSLALNGSDQGSCPSSPNMSAAKSPGTSMHENIIWNISFFVLPQLPWPVSHAANHNSINIKISPAHITNISILSEQYIFLIALSTFEIYKSYKDVEWWTRFWGNVNLQINGKFNHLIAGTFQGPAHREKVKYSWRSCIILFWNIEQICYRLNRFAVDRKHGFSIFYL